MSQNENTKNVRIQQRVDTKHNWETNNPTLLVNEVGYEKETGRYKIGNGEKSWNELPYGSSIDPNEGEKTYIINTSTFEYKDLIELVEQNYTTFLITQDTKINLTDYISNEESNDFPKGITFKGQKQEYTLQFSEVYYENSDMWGDYLIAYNLSFINLTPCICETYGINALYNCNFYDCVITGKFGVYDSCSLINCNFYNCTLDATFSDQFDSSGTTSFNDCKIETIYWTEGFSELINELIFNNCDIKKFHSLESKGEYITFKNCNIDKIAINECTIKIYNSIVKEFQWDWYQYYPDLPSTCYIYNSTINNTIYGNNKPISLHLENIWLKKDDQYATGNYTLYNLDTTALAPYLDAAEYSLEINLYTPEITIDADIILTEYNQIKNAYNAANLLGVVNEGFNTILIQGTVPEIDLYIQAKVVAK